MPSPEGLRQGRGADSQCRDSAKAREDQNGRATAEGSPLPHHTQVGPGVQPARVVVAISVSQGPSSREFEHSVVYKVLCEACKRDVSGATSDKWRGRDYLLSSTPLLSVCTEVLLVCLEVGLLKYADTERAVI